ncbi:uncharacterized protein TNIN_250711 [Trichonephila inaurata madagascariensis]|uniref:Uncharacterized protein n=1 Tax=Trichonephila inaurata madagascariensis TaxID=2747483 RepID=A0A8X7CK23_9ARAC|nr:uncharacterized protein TNIN_250711 [Trichonephila inaurata madagascariensis]
MSIKFRPSLELIAHARIAQGILYTFDLEDLKRTFLEESKGPGDTEYIQPIAKKISEIVLPTYCETFSCLTAPRRKPEDLIIVPLPPAVKKQLKGIVIALGLEIKQWFECHRFIVRRDHHDLRNKLSWFSFGVIDQLETARNFIHDEDWDIGERFHLACKYCFEDDVQMMWSNMTTQKRSYAMRRLPRTRSIVLWLETLHRNIPRNWAEISVNERRNFFSGNYLGIRSYFPKLRHPEIRYQCIYFALERGVVHHYDLYSCIFLLSATELNDLITRLPTTEFCELFKYFSQWPFQIIFLDIVNYFKQHISQDIFLGVVTFMLKRELGWRFQDHMYREIFKPFWNLFSAKYEDCIKKVKMYALAQYVLDRSQDYDVGKYRHLLDLYFSDNTLE